MQKNNAISFTPILKKKLENYKKQLAALNKPEEPFEKRYITSDATIEVLQEIFSGILIRL